MHSEITSQPHEGGAPPQLQSLVRHIKRIQQSISFAHTPPLQTKSPYKPVTMLPLTKPSFFLALVLVLLLHPSTLLAQTVPTPGTLPMLRFQCSQLVHDRIDPLVNPGLTPSPHLHQIVGGASFNATLTHDLPALSPCTSCTFTQDFSNYWTAVLFFRAKNGTFHRVPQALSEGLRGAGGITVYYIPSARNETRVAAFRHGFRMLVGDAAGSRRGRCVIGVCPLRETTPTSTAGRRTRRSFLSARVRGGLGR